MTIQISRSVARWFLEVGRRLISDAYGFDFNPINPVFPNDETGLVRGFIDEIPMDNAPLYSWVEGLLMIIRTLTAIIGNQYELLEEEIISDLTDSNEI